MSDLAGYLARGGRIRLAASAEFVESPSALPSFEATYGFRLSGDQLLTLSGGNTAATLRAAAEAMSGVNAAMAYGTDGAIAALGLTALEDDKGAQVVYAPAPGCPRSGAAAAPRDRKAARSGFRHLDARNAPAAQCRDRRRRRGCRRCRGGLSEIEALLAVTSARGRIGIHNRVLLTLMVAGTVAVAVAGFVSYAPNRLLSGQPITLWEAASGPAVAGIGLLGAMLLAAAFISPGKTAVLCPGGAGGGLAPARAGRRRAGGERPVARRETRRPHLARHRILDPRCMRRARHCRRAAARSVPARWHSSSTAGAIVAGVAALAVAGIFDALSIAREYASRRLLFADALSRHVALVAGSVGLAVVIGFPLGVVAARSPRLQSPLFADPQSTADHSVDRPLRAADRAALGVGGSLPQLAAIGVGGIGVAPAIIALVLYALLPVVRNTAVGLAGVDRAVIEAGRGMGLTSRQIFRQVELPLALPVLLAGLRIVTVQAIGLAVVAALIGAGGLGTFVFEGLGQYAVDLVLLGALPAIFLALAADFLLQTLSAVLRRHLAQ